MRVKSAFLAGGETLTMPICCIPPSVSWRRSFLFSPSASGLLPPAPRKVISHYFVTPFVARVDPLAKIIPEAGEVAYAFEVPLSILADPKRAEKREADVFGMPTTFYAWDHEGETIWGATGRMVADLLRLLGAEHLKA